MGDFICFLCVKKYDFIKLSAISYILVLDLAKNMTWHEFIRHEFWKKRIVYVISLNIDAKKTQFDAKILR